MPDLTPARLGIAWVVVLVASAFGPYVAPGLRTEQVVVYAGALVASWALLRTREGRAELLRGSPVPWVWAALLVLTLLVSLLTWGQSFGVRRGSVPAGLDNLALPLAVLLTCYVLVRLAGHRTALTAACAALVVMACLNTVLALFQNYLGFAHVPVVKPFLVFASDEATIAERAAVNGRFGGVVNQPSESGVIYTLALLALCYLRARRTVPGWVAVLAMALLTIGGMLALSKIFFIGFVVFLAAAALRRATRWWLVPTGIGLQYGLVQASAAGLTGYWGLKYQLRRITDGNESLLWRLTAGRFGDPGTRPTPTPRPRPSTHAVTSAPHPTGSRSTAVADAATTATTAPPRPRSTWVPPREVAGDKIRGGLTGTVDWVMDRRPVTGFGIGGLDAAYDSQVVHAIVIGGVLGLVLVLATCALLAVRWVRQRRHVPFDVSVLAGAVLAVLAVSLIGTPVLVGNRMATLVWLLLGLTLVVPWERRDDPVAEERGGARAVGERRAACSGGRRQAPPTGSPQV